MKVLITGGHGFIGSHVVPKLIDAGHSVRCFVRPTSKTHRIDGLTWEKAVGDIREKDTLAKAIEGCDALVHLASVSSWDDIKSPILEPTVLGGTRNVLEVAAEAKVRTIYCSSATAVNASVEPKVFDENSTFALLDSGLAYAVCKHKAEQLCFEFHEQGNEVVIVNPVETYGPEDDGMVTAGNIRDIMKDWPAMSLTGGTAIAHVDDIAQGIALALDKGRSGERYILGGDNLSIDQLVRLVLDIDGQKKPVLKLPNGLTKWLINTLAKLRLPTPLIPEVLDYATLYWFVDSSKAKQELGYNPRPARETVESVVRWLREAGHVK